MSSLHYKLFQAFSWLSRRVLLATMLCLVVVLAACNSGGGSTNDGISKLGSAGSDGSDGDQPPNPPIITLDEELHHVAVEELGLTGDPATPRGLSRTYPSTDPLAKLGQILFYSQTLSGGFDTSCATCHQPAFGGSDGLSLSVGVTPINSSVIGPGRRVNANRDRAIRADGGPNMPRNSLAVFNAPFFDWALFYDGRVSVLGDTTESGGKDRPIRTPASGNTAELTPADTLLEVAMKFPMARVSDEMRGFLYPDLATPHAYRMHLIKRLRGKVDQQYMSADAAANWLALFRAAFNAPQASGEQVITQPHMFQALAAYIESGIFVNNPWHQYLEGDRNAITEQAKRGALLFLTSKNEGGLGCVACHAGNKFSNEHYYNTGFPQIGRGFRRSNGEDRGRWGQTRDAEDLYAFRVPSLLNVGETAPYGHAGTFTDLRSVIQYHSDPRAGVGLYDFNLLELDQYDNLYMGYPPYPDAEAYTRMAMRYDNFDTAVSMLPNRALTTEELDQLVAFLKTLTDPCLTTPSCRSHWVPEANEDPDGHMLVRGAPSNTPSSVAGSLPAAPIDKIQLHFPSLTPRATFADVQNCSNNLASGGNTGLPIFERRDTDPNFGLDDPHGFTQETWFKGQRALLEAVMISGGVTGVYLDDDCYPDIAYAGGNASGMVFYRNQNGVRFQTIDNLLTDDPSTQYTSVASADLNGDYRRELLFGNMFDGEIPVYSPNGSSQYTQIAGLPMKRFTFGISFGVLDDSGYPYFYTAHWAGGGSGTPGTSPALWRSTGTAVIPWDRQGHTSIDFVDQKFNFTPKFADFNEDGKTDLVIASDFETSMTLENVTQPGGTAVFKNVTDRSVITDENGMGSAILDSDNDGNLEWFVTSVFDPNSKAEANWGITGNRLYEATPSDDGSNALTFKDITDKAGLRDGLWGWGACAADFNNDGFTDIFHVNGFGYIPAIVDKDGVKAHYDNITKDEYQDKPPRLFINNGDGTFTNQASAWHIDVPSEGRGLVCFDYDRDGDIDITLISQSHGLQFFENEIGHGSGRHFLNIRLVGKPPNTDALGARVYATANVGNGHGMQTMMRISQANSNFNSQNPPGIHFGLGNANSVTTLHVVWPDGGELTCNSVAANQFIVLDQRDGNAACPVP